MNEWCQLHSVSRGPRGDGSQAYRRFREGLGRTLLLGLEFLVAADVIRTVAVTPTFRSVGILAGIVAIRTFLSWTLELELNGQWPWRRQNQERAPGAEDEAEGKRL